MRELLWGRRPVPEPGPHAVPVGSWQPATPADLTRCRRQLGAALRDAVALGGAVPAEGARERLLLCLEELASNAVRHGRGPVLVTVTATARHWLLEVTDAAVDRPPTPAVDRDAAAGGLGLYLVARISGAHGWTVDGPAKVSWVRIDHTRAEAPPEIVAAVPAPRLDTTRDALLARRNRSA